MTAGRCSAVSKMSEQVTVPPPVSAPQKPMFLRCVEGAFPLGFFLPLLCHTPVPAHLPLTLSVFVLKPKNLGMRLTA